MTKSDIKDPQKRARKLHTGPPKTRSKNGCLTCRKRKKKCNEIGPICSGCERNYLQCIWPEHRKPILQNINNMTNTTANININNNNTNNMLIEIPLNANNNNNNHTINNNNDQLIDNNEVPIEHCTVFEIPNYKHEKVSKNFESVISIKTSRENDLYNDLLSYVPQTSLPKLPLEESFREILFANGSLLMGKVESAERHYNKANAIITASGDGETWESLAIRMITYAENKLSLCTRACIKTYNIDDLNKTLFYEFMFSYSMLIYFKPTQEIPSPFTTFENFNEDFINVIESHKGINNNNNELLYQIMETSIFNIFESLTKLTWLIKMKLLNKSNIEELKTSISLIWTTIQTTEIQLDNTPHDTLGDLGLKSSINENNKESENKSNNDNDDNNNTLFSMIEFAKLAYMSLQILYLKANDNKVESDSPIIGFYLDQFINSYEIYLSVNGSSIPKFMFIFPLFITACASQTLDQREFISKELYLISYDLKMPFVERLVNDIEESWSLDFNNNTQITFDKLIDGF